MRIYWLGHASFLIETAQNKVITDPVNEKVGYPIYNQAVDIATISHEHWDHNAVEVLKGEPCIIKQAGEYEVSGIRIQGFQSWHDKVQGCERGANIMFKISAEGVDILHLGDLGHLLPSETLEIIGNVDILLIPVGGRFTVDALEAWELTREIDPAIVIPMHFSTPLLSFELAPVEAFTQYFDTVIKKNYLEVIPEDLNSRQRLIILDYASWLTL